MRQLNLEAKSEGAAAPLTPFGQTIVGLEELRRRMEPLDAAKAAAILDALAKQVDGTRRSVEADLSRGAVKKTLGARAAIAVTDLRGTLRRWFDFYNGYDPLVTWWAAAPFQSADTSLQTYATFLRERVAGVRGSLVEPAAATEAVPGAGGGRRSGGGPGGAAASARILGLGVAAPPGATDAILGTPIGPERLTTELAHAMSPYP